MILSSRKGGCCALFLPSGEDGFGQSPIPGQGTGPLRVLRAAPRALGELFNINICNFQGSFEPNFSTQFFIDHLTLPSLNQPDRHIPVALINRQKIICHTDYAPRSDVSGFPLFKNNLPGSQFSTCFDTLRLQD